MYQAAGENPIGAKFFDLFRDTREEWPVADRSGGLGWAEFVRVISATRKEGKVPDEAAGLPASPTTASRNLRPESKGGRRGIPVQNKKHSRCNPCRYL